MANGAAAVRLLDPPSTTPAPTEIDPISTKEKELGTVVADAVTVLCASMWDYQCSGLLSPPVKDAGGTRLAKLAMMQLSHEGGDVDFSAKAREAGKRELLKLFPTKFMHHSPVAVETAIDSFIDETLGIVDKVVRLERSLAN